MKTYEQNSSNRWGFARERGKSGYAVLEYAEIVNPGKYNEEGTTVLLEALAKAGNATATYSLGVMAENRGEEILAARRYAEAKVLEKNAGSDSE